MYVTAVMGARLLALTASLAACASSPAVSSSGPSSVDLFHAPQTVDGRANPSWVAAQRESTAPLEGPAPCLSPPAHDEPLPARCDASTEGYRVECRDACLRARLPDDARRHRVGGAVVVSYVVGADGIFDETQPVRDPGCGLGRAASSALRACCVVVPERGRSVSSLLGREGCHTVEMHLPR